jgi:hypothetical protein
VDKARGGTGLILSTVTSFWRSDDLAAAMVRRRMSLRGFADTRSVGVVNTGGSAAFPAGDTGLAV